MNRANQKQITKTILLSFLVVKVLKQHMEKWVGKVILQFKENQNQLNKDLKPVKNFDKYIKKNVKAC